MFDQIQTSLIPLKSGKVLGQIYLYDRNTGNNVILFEQKYDAPTEATPYELTPNAILKQKVVDAQRKYTENLAALFV